MTNVHLGIPNTYLYLHDLRTGQILIIFWYLSTFIFTIITINCNSNHV